MDHDRDHMFPLAVSACLLGEAVRYDGDRKLDPYITTTLGRYFSFRTGRKAISYHLNGP